MVTNLWHKLKITAVYKSSFKDKDVSIVMKKKSDICTSYF